MKKIMFTSVFVLATGLLLQSCGSDASKEEKSGEPAKDAGTTSSASTGSNSNGMTVAAAKSFLEADEANKGKEVTVTAYSWGSNNRMGGELGLNLGDKKLEGMQQAGFTCIFTKDQAAEAKAVAKDALVTVSGKIAKGAGGIELTECKIISK
jgi:hypothetical protein